MTSVDAGQAKPMKAYVVREDDEGNCAIVFASNGATARRDGANELNLTFEEVESCTREPAFDKFYPGPVPMHATLAAGWWHECGHCGVRFDEDERHCNDEDREDEFEPVQDAQRTTYCSPACMMEAWARRRDEQAREAAAIEATLCRWPLATNVRAGRYSKSWPSREMEMRADFTLPGVKFAVHWVIGASTVTVSQCDLEAFTRLYGVHDAQKGGT